MPKHVRTVGRGFTARTEVHVSGQDMAAAFEDFAKNWNRAWEEGGGAFGAVTLTAVKQCRAIVAAKAEPYEPGSIEDLAKAFLRSHELANAEIGRERADSAARLGFDAGVEWATLYLKWAWEDDALRGEVFREAGARGGRPAGSTRERDAEMAHEYLARREVSGKSDSALKATIGAKRGLGHSASHEAIKRGLQMVSGK